MEALNKAGAASSLSQKSINQWVSGLGAPHKPQRNNSPKHWALTVEDQIPTLLGSK